MIGDRTHDVGVVCEDRRFGQRLACSEFLGGTDGSAERDHRANDTDLGLELGVDQLRHRLREVAVMDTGGRAGVDANDQLLIQPLGHERQDRGKRLRERRQHLVKRGEGSELVGVAAGVAGARRPEPAS